MGIKKPNGYWNYNRCFEEAKKYTIISNFKHSCRSAYNSARKNGWLNSYTWLSKWYPIWTKDKCYEVASMFKYNSDFVKFYPSAYSASVKHGWIDDFNWLIRSSSKSERKVDYVYAYYFDDFKSVYIGRTVDPEHRDMHHNTSEKSSVFKFAKNNNVKVPKMTILESNLSLKDNIGLIKENEYVNKYIEDGWNVLNIAKTGVRSGSLGSLVCKWNYETCYKEAQKYKTRSQFEMSSKSAYNRASKEKWIEDYVWLNKPKTWERQEKPILQFSMHGDIVANFRSIKEAADSGIFCGSGISQCCNGKRKTYKGYIWKFSEE